MSRRFVTFQAIRSADGSSVGPERINQAPVTSVAKSVSHRGGRIEVVKRTYVLESEEVVRICTDGKIKGV